ncbi:G5P family DNA-binding protein [Chromobacterium aquaticum]|uniref:Single-stranded DNA-binding protein n=1 Tax=Chromobacterium aquaticum TaxID=467180 RepID=A0ABV9A1A5_9NEIS|nr:G5P family DNA-binding protein [Chromobacterium aquaticum]MCD5363604.1 G5P family DNA-binding protein [Chromobacterium aquaticum]
MLHVRIEPEDGTVRFKTIKRKSDGQEMQLPQQTVYIYGYDRDGRVDRHPYKSQITLDKGQQPYPPGDYTVHPATSRFTIWGQATEMNLKLISIPEFISMLKQNLFVCVKEQKAA